MIEKLVEAAERAVASGKVVKLTPCRVFGWDGVRENDGCGCLVGAALVDAFGDFRAFREAQVGISAACHQRFGASTDEVGGLIAGFDGNSSERWATLMGAEYLAGFRAGRAFRAKHADKVDAGDD